MAALEQLTTTPATLGEGPCWHGEQQVLYWVDIWGKSLHCFDPANGHDRLWDIGEMVGTVAPRSQGGLLLGLERGFAFFDPTTESLEKLPAVEDDDVTRFNDGKCDPSGRFWCGSMDQQEEKNIGTFYRMTADGHVTPFVSDVGISNGIGWNPDQTVMYFIDSPTKSVFAFDYEKATGDISNRRVAFTLGPDDGWPDGMTTDTEGMIWLAEWAGSRVCRRNPETGEILLQIDVPAPHTSACCFGGPDMNELYITTARKGMTDEQLAEFPNAGNLFRIKTDVTGSPTYSFAG
ncbi:MAG: SMP-30/gluconolactonase/LRE family protein [Planctomycetales bacterium]|nr:SMP-30/gluconolactonase/LRE family protein [Planctomycetales bacterium]